MGGQRSYAVVGAGFDWVITRPFAWRTINLEYFHTSIDSIAGIHPQNGLMLATEAVAWEEKPVMPLKSYKPEQTVTRLRQIEVDGLRP